MVQCVELHDWAYYTAISAFRTNCLGRSIAYAAAAAPIATRPHCKIT